MTAFSSLAARTRHLLLAAAACLGLTLPTLATASNLTALVNGQAAASGAPAGVFQSPQTRAELVVHAPQGLGAGQPAWLGLRLDHAPDWHTYWKNAGDSGLPTELNWTLPEGVSVGDIDWPTPRKFPIGPLANYGYDGTVVLPVPLKVSDRFQGDAVDVQLHATWLVCRLECIPEEARFSARLPVAGSSAAHQALFDQVLAARPQALAAGISRLQPETGFLNVRLDGLPEAWRGRALEFFPETTGLIEPGAAWTQAWDGAQWQARLPLSPHRFESPASMDLVVAPAQPAGNGAGETGARLSVPVQGAWPAAAPAPTAELPEALRAALEGNAPAPVDSASTSALGLGAALLGALIGGLILNLMPCVFPVLAIKAVGFAQHGGDASARRAHGLAYTAGVLLSFLALGGLLLALRAAGEQLGWGFQLQSPAVVAALAVLFTLIGLNLAGLFELGGVLPSGLASLQARHPTADAFLTGVLATAVASPCTAPFMGASLGLAIGLPATQALLVFATLGLGMALPYLLLSWLPAAARLMPRPGPWMQHFKQFMAFPMFATVVWLLWVLGQQSGIDGAAALLMLLVALALLVWALGLGGRSRVWLGALSLAALLALLLGVGPAVLRQPDSGLAADGPTPTGVANLQWEAWSPQREAELRAQGRAVFVDFTAAWCVTCQYNKRSTLADERVLADFAEKQVALLRADWTRRDPAVTQALAALGRSGVPVYALHQSGRPVQVLTELLSVDEVRAALRAL